MNTDTKLSPEQAVEELLSCYDISTLDKLDEAFASAFAVLKQAADNHALRKAEAFVKEYDDYEIDESNCRVNIMGVIRVLVNQHDYPPLIIKWTQKCINELPDIEDDD